MENRVAIATALVGGRSIATTSRMTGVCRRAIQRLLLLLGEGGKRLHNRLVRGVEAGAIEINELWTFVHKKERRVAPGEPSEWGDNWTTRGGLRRMTRLSNGFSHKKAALDAGVALWYTFYNFARWHETICCSPATQAGLTGSIWTIEQLVEEALSAESVRAARARANRVERGGRGEADEHGRMVARGAEPEPSNRATSSRGRRRDRPSRCRPRERS